MQNDPGSGMSPETSSSFRAALELGGGLTLVFAVVIPLLVQVNVWCAVKSDGDDNEHDDFKVRTEERQLAELERTVEQKKLLIEKLKEAHDVLLKEKKDVKAMHAHAHPDSDQASQEGSGHNRQGFENPLQDAAPIDEDKEVV